MYFLIVKNAYWTQCRLPPTISPQTPADPTHAPHHNPWINWGLFYPNSPDIPMGFKSKNTCLLKFNFREILFYKYWTILKKNYPPPGPCSIPVTLDLGPKSKICSHYFWPHWMLSKMIWHDLVAPKTMEEIDFREKARMQARGYHLGTRQVYYPPKHSLTATQ